MKTPRASSTALCAVLAVELALASCGGAPAPPAVVVPPRTEVASVADASTAAPPPTLSPEEAEARLAEMLSPEGTADLSPQAIVVPEGNFRASVLGTGAVQVERREGFSQVSIPIGASGPLGCMVFNDRIDVANSLRIIYESVRRENPRLELRDVGAGFVGDTAYLDLQFLYVARVASGDAIGHVKMRGANVRERGVVCVLDEPGFVSTFDRATRPLLDVALATPRPARYLMRLDDRVVGWSTTHIAPGLAITETSATSMVFPRSTVEFVATDDFTVDRYRVNGDHLTSTQATKSNGDVSNYNLRRMGATLRYQVTGRHMGRDISGSFAAASSLQHVTPTLRRAWRTMRGPRAIARINVLGYSHSNPLEATAMSFRLESAVDAQHAWFVHRHNEIDLRMRSGPAGIPDEVVTSIDGHTLTMRQVTE